VKRSGESRRKPAGLFALASFLRCSVASISMPIAQRASHRAKRRSPFASDVLREVLTKDTPHLRCGAGVGTMSLIVHPRGAHPKDELDWTGSVRTG
jgi:hypothetical protein